MTNMYSKIGIIILVFFCLITNTHNAQEILIYADDIQYDSQENIIAKGNAKVLKNQEIIKAPIIIYNKKDDIFTIPNSFEFKDNKNNFYSGSSGIFSGDLENISIVDVKILLNDNSRLVGREFLREGDIDIITKGAYSPCTSRINVANFVCPIWQLEGEKILHDNDKLFLYQKHSKMKFLNTPVFYLPYLVSPSPLRKKRKSGFLSPSINLNFFDSKIAHSQSLPYYFAIDIDKELLFTPILKYGGGIGSSQRFLMDYDQLLSGGGLSVDVSFDTSIENQNNEDWFKDGSIVTGYTHNINEKFYFTINSSLQTSKNYFRSSDPNNLNSYKTDLSTTLNLYGHNLNQIDDKLLVNVSSYQIIKDNVDNGTTPVALPYIEYFSGNNIYNRINYTNTYNYYNIFRDVNTADHSKKQQKLAHKITLGKTYYNFNSMITLSSEIHNQYFETKGKNIDNVDTDSTYYRIFPMTGIGIETPMREKFTNIIISPTANLIINSGQSNSNKISNEDSTNNSLSISNNSSLNRYSGTDKFDNSKRINYGINFKKNNSALTFSQNYEFSKNSNFHRESGNGKYLSHLLGNFTFENKSSFYSHDIAYDPHYEYIESEYIKANTSNKYFTFNTSYVDTKSIENNNVINSEENIKIGIGSKKIAKYNLVNFSGNYDLLEDQALDYSLGYSYFDECFGINLDFSRKLYKDTNLKPSDTLTLMFSFKNLGAYQSTNLAVSETGKQDIEWESLNLNNEIFNNE